jgi:hypothetical protein
MPAAAWLLFLAAVLAGLFPGVPTTPDPALHPLEVVAGAVRQGKFPATNQIHALGLHPLAALLLTAACTVVIVRDLRAAGRAVAHGADDAPPARAA